MMKQLVKVQSKKEFMDELDNLINSPKTPSKSGSTAGKPAELKTYLVECNSDLHQAVDADGLHMSIDQTGLDHLKILTITDNKGRKRTAQFYLDRSDERFLILHTFDLAYSVDPIIKRLIGLRQLELDNAWLSSGLLKAISKKPGNTEHGFKIDHTDYFGENTSDENSPITPDTFSRMDISGAQSEKILQLLKKDSEIEQIMGYDRITIGRGTTQNGVIEDISYTGRFIVTKGKSIDDHIGLVDSVKADYADTISNIENLSIYVNDSDGLLEGQPLEISFNRKVDDWDKFLDRIFNAKEPFRVFGIKRKISERYYQILCVDIHTGHPLDVEVMDGLFRVYLPQNSCGNVVARLFVNLQRFFDSQTKCSDIQ